MFRGLGWIFSLNVVLKRKRDGSVFMLSNIYGPTCASLKAAFFRELRHLGQRSRGVWAAMGDSMPYFPCTTKMVRSLSTTDILQFRRLLTSVIKEQTATCLRWLGWLDKAEEDRALTISECMLRPLLKVRYEELCLQEEIRDLAKHLFHFFHNTLGVEQTSCAVVNLSSLYDADSVDLSSLYLSFTIDEVKSAIFSYAADKAPGPDGFPMLFYQCFWTILKDDIMDVFDSFYNGSSDLTRLNISWICPIPKKKDVTSARDLRPISLVHSMPKLISKVLATRLQSFMNVLINPFQAAFVKGRYILDNFLSTHILVHHLQSSNQQAALFKIDFERAFDNINWHFLTELLQTGDSASGRSIGFLAYCTPRPLRFWLTVRRDCRSPAKEDCDRATRFLLYFLFYVLMFSSKCFILLPPLIFYHP
uniref:Reverse transcriptase domain-containing protein n=1 Tax=Ananas comosus var. bracteatus TaxID=296719 RepID=A0A6V7QMT9_ANACO|nr:unnamed protein product [Ananas comosus var. bracteatus]